MLLYSTLLCKKISRAPGGDKKVMLTKLGGGGGGGGQNRSAILKFNATVGVKAAKVKKHARIFYLVTR